MCESFTKLADKVADERELQWRILWNKAWEL